MEHCDGKTNSVDSSSTAAGARGGAHLLDTGSLLPPLRQISLDVIQATELSRFKSAVYRQGSERQSIFQDVFNEVRRRRLGGRRGGLGGEGRAD